MSERSRVRVPYRTFVISPSRLLLLKYIGIFKISSHSLHYVYHTNAGLAQVAPSLRVGGKQKLLTSGRGQSAGLLIRRFVVRVHVGEPYFLISFRSQRKVQVGAQIKVFLKMFSVLIQDFDLDSCCDLGITCLRFNQYGSFRTI